MFCSTTQRSSSPLASSTGCAHQRAHPKTIRIPRALGQLPTQREHQRNRTESGLEAPRRVPQQSPAQPWGARTGCVVKEPQDALPRRWRSEEWSQENGVGNSGRRSERLPDERTHGCFPQCRFRQNQSRRLRVAQPSLPEGDGSWAETDGRGTIRPCLGAPRIREEKYPCCTLGVGIGPGMQTDLANLSTVCANTRQRRIPSQFPQYLLPIGSQRVIGEITPTF
jgi:hypothetical protein